MEILFGIIYYIDSYQITLYVPRDHADASLFLDVPFNKINKQQIKHIRIGASCDVMVSDDVVKITIYEQISIKNEKDFVELKDFS